MTEGVDYVLGVWPDGRRGSINLTKEWSVPCVVCMGDRALTPDCGECRGRGRVDGIPFCTDPWNEVRPRLWVGGHDIQGDSADCIVGDQFDLVVSLYRRDGWGPPPGVEHHYHRMADGDIDPGHHTRLDELAELVALGVHLGRKTLVRCQAGLNRSSLVAGKAMLLLGHTADEAVDLTRAARGPYALFNEAFVAHLREGARP